MEVKDEPTKTPKNDAGMDHTCCGNGCRYPRCENQLFAAERKLALLQIEAIARTTGAEVLPLDVVAPLLPVQPEWREFMKPRRGRPRK